MRRMSFFLTTEQMRNKTKTVTRRKIGTWRDLKVGDVLLAVKQLQGLKKGEGQTVIGKIRITGERMERVDEVTNEDVVREGFPNLTRIEFLELLKRRLGLAPDDLVTRIEFEHIGGAE